MYKQFHIEKNIVKFCKESIGDLQDLWHKIDETEQYNQWKVISAMQNCGLSDYHFNHSTGYGYHDIARNKTEEIFASVFHAEDALVRPQIISGTHALAIALFGNLRPGDELISPVGKPYDTLEQVIGFHGENGSLKDYGIQYKQIDFLDNGEIDYETFKNSIGPKTKLITIQRSKGYQMRASLQAADIKQLIALTKEINPGIICMVDNCYGEFVKKEEPLEWGADLIVGSLIKNPGGGLASCGGYICGKKKYVENASLRFSAPGLGKEIGPGLGAYPNFLQGLFLAPASVSAALKTSLLFAHVFERLHYKTHPKVNDARSCIVQGIQLNSREAVLSFCEAIQSAAAVDSHVLPCPSAMPGYDHEIVMACGSFIQGASIELSADAPLVKPYHVYFQGSLTKHHGILAVMRVLQHLNQKNIINIQ